MFHSENINNNSFIRNELYKKTYIIIFAFFLFFFEIYYRTSLKNISIKYFFSTNQTRCSYFIYTNYLEIGLKYFLFYFSYNFINVFNSITMIAVDALAISLTNNMKLLYHQPRPFMEYPQFQACHCMYSYSNPSSNAMSLYLVIGVLYQGILAKNRNKNNYQPFFIWILWFICVTYCCYVRLLQNVVYLNNIIYGIGLGYIVYYIMFSILNIDFTNFNQLLPFYKRRELVIGCLLQFIILNALTQYSWTEPLELDKLREEYKLTISQTCPQISEGLFLDKANYVAMLKLFELVGFFMGVLFEYLYLFKENDSEYTSYNIVEYNQNSEMMFSRTKYDVSVFRLILFCVSHYYYSKHVNLWVEELNMKNMFMLFYSLPIIGTVMLGIFQFFIMKIIMKKIGVTNENLFNNEINCRLNN